MRWDGRDNQIPWIVILGIVACLGVIAIVAWYAVAP
jgi:hypothetical protein